ncbi:hypothetical protein [Azohydromonas caseinilytica]|uniref:SPOR domain-containing protein n=1 Tax=Azohydromonas caseinilytica TaxID=2728836 RepID=A0A848FBW3_9BURK|nr:hypothetical protein [Azohydromonas caseinilytica]NML16225.1 hypothetical protein [Azohydromonas caseinilytica]
MRRPLAALLLLINLALLTWVLFGDFQGRSEREPARLQQQLNPEGVRVVLPESGTGDAGLASLPRNAPPAAAASDAALTASAAALAMAASAVPAGLGASTAAGGLGPVAGAVTALNAVCLEAGPFDMDDLPAAEAVLTGLPAGSWRRVKLEPEPAYLVYAGPFANQKAALRRLDDLQRHGVDAELARELPALEPGLVFSRHTEMAQALAALEKLQHDTRNTRQARVVSTSEAAAVLLRVERPTDEVRGQIAALEPTPALRGGFRGCRKTAS